jgi:hypothetical protein
MSTSDQSYRKYLWVIYLLIAFAAAITYRHAPQSHFQSEIDVIRANAARTIAEWAPNFTDTAMMLNAQALTSGETFMPGTWFYHGLVMKLFGPDPSWHFIMALFVHMMAAWSAAALAGALYGRAAAAWAGLIFVLHPALAGITPGFANGPAMLALFWITQASLRYLRFIQSGGLGQLIAAMLCSFLAVSTDGIGVFAIVMILCLEIFYRSKGQRAPMLSRVFSLTACIACAMLFYLALRVIGVPLILEHVRGGLDLAGMFRAVVFVFKAMSIPSATTGALSFVAIIISTALLLAGVYKGLADYSRFVPVAAFVPAILISLPFISDPGFPHPDTAVAFICPALCFSLIIGDLISGLKNRYILVGVLAFTTSYFSSQTADRVELAVARGRQIRLVAGEINEAYQTMPGEADIYLIDDGIDSMPLLVGHLDFVYRYGLTHQTRFSFVHGGFLFSGDARSPVGKIGNVMRLEINRAMSLIGWDATHDGLVVLNPIITEKMMEAESLMDQNGRKIEPFSLGGEGAIRAWQPVCGQELIAPGPRTYRWFIEAPIFRLHPIVGRKAKNFD